MATDIRNDVVGQPTSEVLLELKKTGTPDSNYVGMHNVKSLTFDGQSTETTDATTLSDKVKTYIPSKPDPGTLQMEVLEISTSTGARLLDPVNKSTSLDFRLTYTAGNPELVKTTGLTGALSNSTFTLTTSGGKTHKLPVPADFFKRERACLVVGSKLYGIKASSTATSLELFQLADKIADVNTGSFKIVVPKIQDTGTGFCTNYNRNISEDELTTASITFKINGPIVRTFSIPT